MGDGVSVQRLDSRNEPPLVEESARTLDPRWSNQPFASAEVLGNGGEQSVVACIPGRDWFRIDKDLAIDERSTLNDLDAPKGEPKSCRFVALGETQADLKTDVGDGRALIGHITIVEAG